MEKTCVIFCAGDFDKLAVPISSSDLIIAADGGLLHTGALGLRPHVILGDFDSLGEIPRGAGVCAYPVMKDDTDAMLAVRCGLTKGFRRFLIYGGLDGPRLDHALANFQTLVYLAEHDAQGILVGKKYFSTALRNGSLVFPSSADGILSIFCMGSPAQGVTLEGLLYPLTEATLTAGYPLGVSNHFTGKAAHVQVRQGNLLLLWDRENGFPDFQKNNQSEGVDCCI
jgi:thiamine pyrophosphokinase